MLNIRAFINGWNDRCQPFVWTKTADQILTKPTVKQLQWRSATCLIEQHPLGHFPSQKHLLPDQHVTHERLRLIAIFVSLLVIYCISAGLPFLMTQTAGVDRKLPLPAFLVI